MLASSGYVAATDDKRCVGCGACAEICPFDAISMADERAVVDWDRCMGCGVCVAACPQSALALERDATKGEPLRVRDLEAARAG